MYVSHFLVPDVFPGIDSLDLQLLVNGWGHRVCNSQNWPCYRVCKTSSSKRLIAMVIVSPISRVDLVINGGRFIPLN